MSVRNVLIVGSGIAGQTLACALARRHIDCDVIELKAAWQIIGSGMYMQGNALRALADIGVVEEIVAQGWHAADDVSHITDREGTLLAAVQLPRIAGPRVPAVNPILRHTLHGILRDAVDRAGVRVRMGLTVELIEDDPEDDAVEVCFTDGTRGRYDLVVGADGIRSGVRDLLFPGVKPVYTGFSTWRVALPRPQWAVRPTWMMGRGRSFGVIPLSADRCYIAGVSKEAGNPWLERSSLRDLMRERFAQFGGPAPELLAAIGSSEDVVYTPVEEVLLPLPWTRGRVVILGDAAHASTPFWGQGASMAIEDVVLLASLLEHPRPIDDIFAEWTRRRHPRCLYVQDGSMATGRRSHDESDGAPERLVHYLRNQGAADIRLRYETLAEAI